jgi:hypothetical protein
MSTNIYRQILSISFAGWIVMFLGSFNVQAVDETIPHPIDERGLMSEIAVKTTRLFRPVEILEIHNAGLKHNEMTITRGTVLVLDNKSNNNHRLMFPAASSNTIVVEFTSTVIEPEKLWGAQFIDVGVYPFHCSLHPEQEHGIITVIESQPE